MEKPPIQPGPEKLELLAEEAFDSFCEYFHETVEPLDIELVALFSQKTKVGKDEEITEVEEGYEPTLTHEEIIATFNEYKKTMRDAVSKQKYTEALQSLDELIRFVENAPGKEQLVRNYILSAAEKLRSALKLAA